MTRHAAASSRNNQRTRDGAGTMGLERDSETARLSQAGRPLAPPTDNADGGTAVEPIHRQSPETAGPRDAARCAQLHTPCPGDYMAWHAWAHRMTTAGWYQQQCPECGKWAVWVPSDEILSEAPAERTAIQQAAAKLRAVEHACDDLTHWANTELLTDDGFARSCVLTTVNAFRAALDVPEANRG